MPHFPGGPGGDLRYSPFMLQWALEELPEFKGRTTEPGLVIGQFTEGWGIAQMCPQDPAGFCLDDIRPFHPLGGTNWPDPFDPEILKTELHFPEFLRNPAQGSFGAGDIIPPSSRWEPFLYLSPDNGTLYLDPAEPSRGYWTDLTYAHGRTVYAGQSVDVSIEMPRSSGQLFYQFDDLFHDNAIFSPHPALDPGRP